MNTHNDLRAIASKIGFDPDYLAAFEAKLFIQGPDIVRRLTNFFVLLLLATIIATYGVITDSTATVIGAMIVAPLMGPIMATAAAVVMGSAQRAVQSLALVVAGVISVIVLATGLAWIVPDVSISFSENSQLTSRIAPGLMALLTALASGAAGAFIMSREEIADSMGGVAIVVGIALRVGEWEPAAGAFMLFLTNFLAILLAGGITFRLGGLGRLANTGQHVRLRRNAFILIILSTILVAVPLSITTYEVVTDALEDRAALEDVDAWLDGTTYEIVAVDVYDRNVSTTIDGYGEMPQLRELVKQLAVSLKRPVNVKLRVLPTVVESSADAAPNPTGP
jgi:uncharacterized hydrophobic protein (TIGR00271 family)